jgi:hypothetical protein
MVTWYEKIKRPVSGFDSSAINLGVTLIRIPALSWEYTLGFSMEIYQTETTKRSFGSLRPVFIVNK